MAFGRSRLIGAVGRFEKTESSRKNGIDSIYAKYLTTALGGDSIVNGCANSRFAA
jgi:hypothetical protein